MPRAVFPFPGGKSHLASWITEHTCYVEVFGGAAGVLFNKPRSDVEVYNNRDRVLVQFFKIFRASCIESDPEVVARECGLETL
jgi:DNA adenine methylase